MFLWNPPKEPKRVSLPSIGDRLGTINSKKPQRKMIDPFGAKNSLINGTMGRGLDPLLGRLPFIANIIVLQPHSQFVTSLSTVHIQNTEYALCPRLTHRIYTNIHDFGIYLHICVSKRLQKQHIYCQCRGAWGIVYVFFPLRTHKCPTGETGKYIKYILYGGKITNEDEEHRRRGYGWLHGCFLGCLRFFRSFH